jgi:hypothetical protein
MRDRFIGGLDDEYQWEPDEEEDDNTEAVPKGYVVGESDDWGYMILKQDDNYPVFSFSVLRYGFITREAAILWITLAIREKLERVEE